MTFKVDQAAAAELPELLRAQAAPGQPTPLLSALGNAYQRLLGWKLYTALVVAPGGREVERLYSSDPEAYPIGRRKLMGPTEWGAQVLRRGESYLGNGAADMEWAFPDHALIAQLSLGSVINVAIRYDGQVLGALSLLDSEGSYDPTSLNVMETLAPAATPAFWIHSRALMRAANSVS